MSERYQPFRSARKSQKQSAMCSELPMIGYGRDLDATKRDRFELLSAYLDGEVSPEERRLVMIWLDEDPETQCLYQRLLQLRQGFRGLNAEHWEAASPGDTANQVMRKLNHRLRMTWMAGMTAAAVLVAGLASGALNPIERLGGAMSAATSEDSLEIALDQPPITIPKPAMTPASLDMDLVSPEATDASDI